MDKKINAQRAFSKGWKESRKNRKIANSRRQFLSDLRFIFSVDIAAKKSAVEYLDNQIHKIDEEGQGHE